MLKAFIKECLFFQTDKTRNPTMPTWILGIWAWLSIILLVISIYKIIKP